MDLTDRPVCAGSAGRREGETERGGRGREGGGSLYDGGQEEDPGKHRKKSSILSDAGKEKASDVVDALIGEHRAEIDSTAWANYGCHGTKWNN